MCHCGEVSSLPVSYQLVLLHYTYIAPFAESRVFLSQPISDFWKLDIKSNKWDEIKARSGAPPGEF